MFRYHLDDTAIGVIQGKNGTIAGTNMTVNWMDFLNDANVPFTTTECMHYPPQPQEAGRAWGDRSSRYGNGASVIPLPAWHLPRRGGLLQIFG